MTSLELPMNGLDARQYLKSIDEDGVAEFSRVKIQELSFEGRFGKVAFSDTTNDVSIGDKTFYLDYAVEMRVGDDVQISCRNNPDLYMWGEIADVGGEDTQGEMWIRVFVDDICPFSDPDQTGWEIQIVGRPKPGIEKDVSLTEFNPTHGGPWALEVTAGKFFPVGGQLLIKPTTDRTIALLGRVAGYDGTTLTVNKTVTNATVDQTYDSWSIALLDAPIQYSQSYVDGLQIRQTPDVAYSFVVSAGSIMDSTGEVLLTLTNDAARTLGDTFGTVVTGPYEGCVVQVPLTGTIGSSGTTVTGTGTDFETDFDDTTTVAMDDYGDFFVNILNPVSPTIYSGSAGRQVNTVASDTSLSIMSSWTLSAGASYGRNALLDTLPELEKVVYFIYIIRNPTTGDVNISANTRTILPRQPDLPSGYTQWRLIASIECYHRGGNMDYFRLLQPHHAESINITPAQFLNVTPLSVLGNVSTSGTTADWIVSGSGNRVLRSTVGNGALEFGKVALEDLATQVGESLIGNTTGSTTTPTAFKISDLAEATPVAGDWVLLSDSSDGDSLKKADVDNFGGGGDGVGANFADYGLITDTPTSTVDYGTIV